MLYFDKLFIQYIAGKKRAVVDMKEKFKASSIRDFFQKYPAMIGVIVVALLIIIVYVVYQIRYNRQNEQQQERYEELNKTAWITDMSKVTETEQTTPEELEKAYREANEEKMEQFLASCTDRETFEKYLNSGPDFEAYRAVNSDVVGYILIPDTRIDYPVLRDVLQRDYYLKRNLDGSSGYPGSIFMENINSPDFDDPVTILYGHNMKNHTMFAQVHDFHNNAQFREAHKYIYTYEKDSVNLYEVVACTSYSDVHLLADNFVKDGSGEFVYTESHADDPVRMWDSLKDYGDGKAYFAEEPLTEEDKCIVLSTCGSGRVRVVVVAKLLFTHWH